MATNNVAEYRGPDRRPRALPRAHARSRARGADGLQARRRADVRPLEDQAPGHEAAGDPGAALAPSGTTYTWIPREQNKHADRILNEALDEQAGGRARAEPPGGPHRPAADAPRPAASARNDRGWCRTPAPPTTLVLVRHGVTAHTVDKRFSGGLGGSNPGLSDEGRAQIRATADWLSPLAEEIDVVVSSPVRRTQRVRGDPRRPARPARCVIEDGLAEMEFGTWDGMTFAEIKERYPDDLDAWLGLAGPPAGRRRVVPRRGEAGARQPRPAARGVRRRDGAGRQPRDADQGRWSRTPSRRRWSRSTGWSWRPPRSRCCRSSTTATPRCGCSTRRPTEARRHRSLTDHVEPGCRACRRGPASTFQPRSPSRSAKPCRACAACAPSSSRARTSRPLVALLKCDDHLAACRPPRAAPARSTTRRARSGAGPPERRVRRRAQVDDQPVGRRPRATAASRRRPQYVDTVPRPGSATSPGEPVRRDPVGRPQQPEQARGDRQPARWPADAPRRRATARSSAS